MAQTYIAVRNDRLSNSYQQRYVIIDKETGEILDDANGYGYKSKQKAYAAYGWKTRDTSKDAERAEKKHKIKRWMKEHKSFMRDLDQFAFEIYKGSWGPDDKVDVKFIKDMFKEYGFETEFNARDFFKVWCGK